MLVTIVNLDQKSSLQKYMFADHIKEKTDKNVPVLLQNRDSRIKIAKDSELFNQTSTLENMNI